VIQLQLYQLRCSMVAEICPRCRCTVPLSRLCGRLSHYSIGTNAKSLVIPILAECSASPVTGDVTCHVKAAHSVATGTVDSPVARVKNCKVDRCDAEPSEMVSSVDTETGFCCFCCVFLETWTSRVPQIHFCFAFATGGSDGGRGSGGYGGSLLDLLR
jgi:hypothetical protein